MALSDAPGAMCAAPEKHLASGRKRALLTAAENFDPRCHITDKYSFSIADAHGNYEAAVLSMSVCFKPYAVSY